MVFFQLSPTPWLVGEQHLSLMVQFEILGLLLELASFLGRQLG